MLFRFGVTTGIFKYSVLIRVRFVGVMQMERSATIAFMLQKKLHNRDAALLY